MVWCRERIRGVGRPAGRRRHGGGWRMRRRGGEEEEEEATVSKFGVKEVMEKRQVDGDLEWLVFIVFFFRSSGRKRRRD